MYGQTIGIRAKSHSALVAQVKNGLPISAMERLSKTMDVPERDLAHTMNIPLRTLSRRKQEGKFKSDESQRLWRLARLYERAIDVLGDTDSANEWFRTRVKGLGYKTPLEYAETEPGAVEVENMLGRIEDGLFY